MHPRLLLICNALACTNGPIPTPDSTESDPDCCIPGDPDSIFGPIEVVANEDVSTVFRINWSPRVAGESWIEAGLPGEPPRTLVTTETANGGRSALWVGLKPETNYEARVVLRTEDDTLCTTPIEIETGTLPAGLPSVEYEVIQPDDVAGGYTLIPLVGDISTQRYQLILDSDGEPVWYSERDATRMRLSLDGQAILVNHQNFDPDQMGVIERIPLDGSEPSQVEHMGIHMDFAEVEPGVVASFGWDIREFEEEGVILGGESILEIAADGTVREVWNIFDHVTPDFDNLDQLSPMYCCEEVLIWAHLNHLHYAPEEDAYYVTSREMDAVFKIDRSSGELRWILSNTISDFTLVDGSEPVYFDPHSAVPTEQGVLVYDTSSPLTDRCTAISEFRLNEETWEVEHLGLYSTEDCQLNTFMGNGESLWNGNRTLVLALGGQIDEVTDTGELVSRWTGPQGYWFGFTSRIPDMTPSFVP